MVAETGSSGISGAGIGSLDECSSELTEGTSAEVLLIDGSLLLKAGLLEVGLVELLDCLEAGWLEAD